MSTEIHYGQLHLNCPSCEKDTVVLIDALYEQGSVLYDGIICDHCGCVFSFDLSAEVLNKKVIEEGEE